MNETNLHILLPSDKDGGGNRWSYLLANNLYNYGFKITLHACSSKKEKKNIYYLNKNITKKATESPLPRILSLYFFIRNILKVTNKKSIILVSDPILSIFLYLLNYKKIKVIRNIAADDRNLYNYSKYLKYSGLLFLYRIFLKFSFLDRNTTHVFNSEYTYIKSFNQHKLFFSINNIEKKIIHPMMSDTYFAKKKIKNKKENIVVLPRKHTTKGFALIEKLVKSEFLKSLGIKKVFLVFNENISIPNSNIFEIINPNSDNEIIEVFDKSFCFISTSSNEGFGLPPLEAMSRNCIPIIGEAGGNAVYSKNYLNCLTYDTKNIEHLYDALRYLYENDELADNLIKNFKSTISPHSESVISNQWKELIIEVSGNFKMKNIDFNKYFISNCKSFIHKAKSIDSKLFKKLLLEVTFYPLYLISNFTKNIIFNFFYKPDFNKKIRAPLDSGIHLCVQDWVMYENIRYKKLKNGLEYKCGLLGQNIKFISQKYNIMKSLYISGDKEDLKNFYFEKINSLGESFKSFKIHQTSNDLLDFSAYKLFYKNLNKAQNNILIFCNSSLSLAFNHPIIDRYIDTFISDESIGILGISSNTRDHQSFIMNNFEPHIQTLFFITTTNILNEVVKKNGNIFPGSESTSKNKYSIIQNGELVLSRMILDLGYSIAVIDQFGKLFTYNMPKKLFRSSKSWSFEKNDLRLNTLYPSQAKIIG